MRGELQPIQRKETTPFLLPRMQKGLLFLELPLVELGQLIQKEMDENPLLESEEEKSDDALGFVQTLEKRLGKKESRLSRDFNTLLENNVAYENSLFDTLINQAKERFPKADFSLATAIIGHLESDGLLKTPLSELANFTNASEEKLKAVLKTIQEFEPAGIAARDIREALLIQLKRKGKENNLSYLLVSNYFSDICKGKISEVAKKMKMRPEEIQKVLAEELVHLRCHPGADLPRGHYSECVLAIIPDLFILASHDDLSISVNDEKLPKLRINESLLKKLSEERSSEELHLFIKEKLKNGSWLMRHLFEREKTLFRVGEKIIERQKNFFTSPKGQLLPWTMKELARDLSLHESTIARAIQGKYASTPRGILPLRSFFTNSMETARGESVSSSSIKEIVHELIVNEDPKDPLSDEAISALLKKRGLLAARRTVAKYRTLLNLPTSSQRRRF